MEEFHRLPKCPTESCPNLNCYLSHKIRYLGMLTQDYIQNISEIKLSLNEHSRVSQRSLLKDAAKNDLSEHLIPCLSDIVFSFINDTPIFLCNYEPSFYMFIHDKKENEWDSEDDDMEELSNKIFKDIKQSFDTQ